MLFRRYQDHRRRERVAHALYAPIVEQFRLPVFYETWDVPDTVDGRFDLLAIHAFLVMRRLGRIGADRAEEGKVLSQAVFDLMFADMDQNLREMGVNDLAVGRKVHQMAEAFYGRVNAYDKAFGEGEGALADAVARNLYRKAEEAGKRHAAIIADYMRRLDSALSLQADGDLMEGRMALTPLD